MIRDFSTDVLESWGVLTGMRDPSLCSYIQHLEVDRVGTSGVSTFGDSVYLRYAVVFRAPDDGHCYRVCWREAESGTVGVQQGAVVHRGLRVEYVRGPERDAPFVWRVYDAPFNGYIDPSDFGARMFED